MFFTGWEPIGRTFIIGALAYVILIALVRISGKRTLAKMNAFDFVVTVALGSTLATILLAKDVALAQGIAALGLLVVLQYAIAWLSSRTRLATRLAKAEPTLLVDRGRFLPDALANQRVLEEEVLQAVRAQGYGDLEQVAAVVLETNGQLSVIGDEKLGRGSALRNVARVEPSQVKSKTPVA